MAVTVSDLRAYLNQPPDADDALQLYLDRARSKARAAGIPDYERNKQYDGFLLELAAFYYDNRGLSFAGSYQATAEANAPRMIDAYVLELRYAGEDPEEEDDGQ